MMIKPFMKAGVATVFGGIACLMAAGSAAAQNMDRLAEADANGDGSIEWQELVDMRASIFERLDRNDDGVVSSKDSPNFGPGKGRFGQALEQVKQSSDADGDGQITKTEMLEAPSPLFDNGDTNEDKILSAEELSALRASAGL
ncbi:MAG: signal transduction protein [Pseudomonadota bacterium]